MKRIAILGSTGSIGVNALDVLRRLNRSNGARPSYQAWGLAADKNVGALKKQILEFRPSAAAVADPRAAAELKTWARRRAPRLKVWEGRAGLERLAAAPETDLLLSGVVGAAGLAPLMAAVRAGKKVALANKESLVAAGGLITAEAKRSGAELIPVDSEHSAMFQCLQSSPRRHIRRLILTASGGAFYKRKGSLDKVTARQALNHPTWKMGDKITIDCATLMNKGLEAIEAHHLFGVPMDKIGIVVHPQSIVHSLVEFSDGAMLAQLSHPDMRLPIQYALTHPDRLPTPLRTLELEEVRRLDFRAPNFRRFPCLELALSAGRRGGTWPAALNGANEDAVRAFLEGRLSFLGIPRVIRRVLEKHKPNLRPALEDVHAADEWSRREAEAVIDRMKEGG
ncbi:MAG: 1-deoxy-D-xylulose-5-phosphate reductoisomerase [Elusimicrobiota bacterium]